jgi:hypothetical protein
MRGEGTPAEMTAAALLPPPAPTSLSVTRSSEGAVITWGVPENSPNNAPVTGFAIYRQSADGEFVLIAVVNDSNARSFIDIEAPDGTASYRVATLNGSVTDGAVSMSPSFELSTSDLEGSLVIAAIPRFWLWSSRLNANTSATPVGLGTAGRIEATAPTEAPPALVLVHAVEPGGNSLAKTATSAEPDPALTVTCPDASAVSTGGSSGERLTTFGSLEVHVSPVTERPAASTARMVCVSPTTMFSIPGVTVFSPLTGTVKPTALLQTPFC